MKLYIRMIALLDILILLLAWSAARHAERTDAQSSKKGTEKISVSSGSDAAKMLHILHGGEIEQMDMFTYLCGVLRAEMPASFELEALKAQAIAARTYTLYRIENGPIAAHPDADACDDITCCKAYMDADAATRQWGNMAEEYEAKVERAVSETDGQVVLYCDEPILAVFCSSVGGETQNAGAVWRSDLPYLQSVDSPETETLVPNYYSVVTFETSELKEMLLAAYPDAKLSSDCGEWIADITRNEAGFVTSVSVGGVAVRGNDLRAALSLRSPCFSVYSEGNTVTFHVTGYGHGVGMSQYGANILAQEGKTCEEILTHYYTDTTVGRWQT